MDCVTCMLMGMCMLCTSDMGASEPGRPMTQAEVNRAVGQVVHRFRDAAEEQERSRSQREQQEQGRDVYERRKSFYDDLRFSNIGIGKRKSAHVPAILEKPQRNRTAIPESLNNKVQPRFVAGRVLFLLPSPDTRKLTISQLPSRARAGSSTMTLKNLSKNQRYQFYKDNTEQPEVYTNGLVDHRSSPVRAGRTRHAYVYKFDGDANTVPSTRVLRLIDVLQRSAINSRSQPAVQSLNRSVEEKRRDRLNDIVVTKKLTPKQRQILCHLERRSKSEASCDERFPTDITAMLLRSTQRSVPKLAAKAENLLLLKRFPSLRKLRGIVETKLHASSPRLISSSPSSTLWDYLKYDADRNPTFTILKEKLDNKTNYLDKVKSLNGKTA